MFVNTLAKLKTVFGMYGNPIEIPVIRKNRFGELKSLKLGKNVSNFTRIASLCEGLHCVLNF